MTTLWSFTGINGDYPRARLMQGSDGNFYGTTASYYNSGDTLFRITPAGSLTNLVVFSGTNAPYGRGSYGSLLQLADGSLVGTTYLGGEAWNPAGRGTIFQFRTNGVFSGLISFFFNGTNGAGPHAGLIQTRDGSLYGTTTGSSQFSGQYYGFTTNGTVFRISPEGNFTTVFFFNGTNGAFPSGNLLQAADGALYGTTAYGGLGFGTVFKITTNGLFSSLFSFAGTSGANPTGELIQLDDGNLYGTTSGGGASNLGTVFRITTNGALTTIASLDNTTGSSPQGGLFKANDGNLYGTASAGGPGGGGTVFRMVERPVIASISQSNGNVTLTWTSFAGAAYRVEYRAGINSGPWLTLNPRVTSAGSTTSLSDSVGSEAKRYYRVVLLPW